MALLDDVKLSLGISSSDTNLNSMLNAKILAVKEYIDLPEAQINTELGTALIVIGVQDLMNLEAGEIKFSPAFHQLFENLYIKSL
jgi:hypothetical protein